LYPSDTGYANYCAGFKITSQTDPSTSYPENSEQEVTFDFTGSMITEVEYVDLIRYDDKAVVDEWATGPYYPSNPKTGLHVLGLYNADPGYFQFLVTAATTDGTHCEYYSSKFMITSNATVSQSSDSSVPQPTDSSYVSPVVQLKALLSTDSYSTDTYSTDTYSTDSTTTDTTSTTSDTTTTTTTSSSSAPTLTDSTTLVSIFKSILTNLATLAPAGDSIWQANIQSIEDALTTVENDVVAGQTSGPTWVSDVDTLKQALDLVKTSGNSTWTDHIASLDTVLDQLAQGTWNTNYQSSEPTLEAFLSDLESATQASATTTSTTPSSSDASSSDSSVSSDPGSTPAPVTSDPASTPAPVPTFI